LFDADKLTLAAWKKQQSEFIRQNSEGLLPFIATYLSETGFSALAVMKTEYRSQFLMERELRLSISSATPLFDKPCGEKQAHPSH
jgi:hypothetical protein